MILVYLGWSGSFTQIRNNICNAGRFMVSWLLTCRSNISLKPTWEFYNCLFYNWHIIFLEEFVAIFKHCKLEMISTYTSINFTLKYKNSERIVTKFSKSSTTIYVLYNYKLLHLKERSKTLQIHSMKQPKNCRCGRSMNLFGKVTRVMNNILFNTIMKTFFL